jgi:Xaa-Pro aminopeptidase
MSTTTQTAPKALFEQRWARLQAAMEEQNLDALIVASRGVIGAFGNVFYLCGYTPLLRVSYGVLHRSGEPVLFLPSGSDQALALQRGIINDVRSSAEMEVVRADVSTAQSVAREVAADKPARVGIVGLGQIVPVGDYAVFQDELKGVELVDASGMYAALKQFKTAEDIERVKAAFGLAQRAYEAAPGLIGPGVRAQEVVAELERILRSDTGTDSLVFVDSSPQWVRRNTDTVFDTGHLIMVLVEVSTSDGYFVEQGGLVSVGEPSDEARRVSDACYAALKAVGEAIKPGAPVTAATDAHEEIGRSAGLELGLSLGHGIGVDHDLPTLYRTDASVFQPGHVISVHPYYWHPNKTIFGGVGDAFHVTDDGSERMGVHEYELAVV